MAPERGGERLPAGRQQVPHYTAFILALATLASQALAVLRDRLLSSLFGASALLDAYYTAFRLPDLFFLFLGSVGSAFALIPYLTHKERDHNLVVCRLVASVVLLGGAGGVLLLVGAPLFIPVLFPHLAPEQRELVIALVRILAFQPLFLGLAMVWGSVAQAQGAFRSYGIALVVYNLVTVLAILLWGPSVGVKAAAVGVLGGAAAQALLLGGWWVRSSPPLSWACFTQPDGRLIRTLLTHNIPRRLALATSPFLHLLLTTLAGAFLPGAIAAFFLASNLASIPVSLLAVSYATATFPLLARWGGGGGDHVQFSRFVREVLRILLWWLFFAMVSLIVFREEVVRLILGSGNFDWRATRLTAAVLGILALTLPAQGIVHLAARAWYALSASVRPFVSFLIGIGGGALFVGVLLGMYHAAPLFRRWVDTTAGGEGEGAIVAAALGIGGGIIVQSVALLAPLFRRYATLRNQWGIILFKLVIASLLSGSAMYMIRLTLIALLPLTSAIAVAGVIVVGGAVGAIVYGTVSYLIGLIDVEEVVAPLRRVFRRR